MESIVYSKADRAIDGMEQNLDYLSVVIGLAPMLGLLGTITGMISSFNALNERAQNPMAVTAGIGEALITTVFGLCIAIMGMCIHAYLSSKVKNRFAEYLRGCKCFDRYRSAKTAASKTEGRCRRCADDLENRAYRRS